MRVRQTSHTSSTTSAMSSTSSWVRYVKNVPSKATENQMENAYTAAAESVKNKYATSQIPFASNRSIKVMKEVNLTGRPMRVRVITSDGDIVPTEAPEDDEDASTSEPRDPAIHKLDKMGEMIDEVVLKDLPKIVAAVAAKISHRPFESEIPKAASRMVVKLLTETPVRDVPDAIIQMLMELASRERPNVDPLPLVQSALQQILDDYRAPRKESISKVVDQAMDSAQDLEAKAAKAEEAKEAEPQSEKVLRVITDAADHLAKGSSDDSEDVDISTTQGSEAEEETAEASSASDETSETETETEDSNSSNVTDGAINSAEVLPDEDQPYTAAEMMKSAKEHKGTAIPSSASGTPGTPSQRPIAVHSVHSPGAHVVKAVSPGSDKHAGEDDHDEEEELEVESPAKSGGKVLVGLTVFRGSLLMVVAITSAGYMAYQRSQEQRQPRDAAPAQAPAASPAPAAASTRGSRASGASGASGAGAAPADAPTFTGGPGGPEAGA